MIALFVITRLWCTPTHVQSKPSSDFHLKHRLPRYMSTKFVRKWTKSWILSNSWATGWRMQLIIWTLESLNAFEKCLDFMLLNAMKCDCGIAFLYATCTEVASHKRLGIYLSSFTELTVTLKNIITAIFLIGESYICPTSKPVYVWSTESIQSMQTVVYLRKRSHNRFLPRLCHKLRNTRCRSFNTTVG